MLTRAAARHQPGEVGFPAAGIHRGRDHHGRKCSRSECRSGSPGGDVWILRRGARYPTACQDTVLGHRGTGTSVSPHRPCASLPPRLGRIEMDPSEVDLWELNEAFAAVTLNSTRMLGIDADRVNVNGGAVALGHPIGASGARILLTLAYELRRRGGGVGVAAICSGTAQGDAVVIEVEM